MKTKASDCEHKIWVTDNVAMRCLECDEQRSAVPIVDWPRGCRAMYAGPGMDDACICGAAWTKVPGFVYCSRCDMESPPTVTAQDEHVRQADMQHAVARMEAQLNHLETRDE